MGQCVSVNIPTNLQVESFDKTILPRGGVRLSFLKEFISNPLWNPSGIKYDFNGKTTTDVCNDVVMVLTKQYECSLCDLLKALNHNAFCEKADVYISHAWKYPFLDVIAILEHHFKDNPNVIVWFDLFCNNQHQAIEFEFDWWATNFMNLIGRMDKILNVMIPWRDPIPMRRCWWVYEMYCAISQRKIVDVALPESYIPDVHADPISFYTFLAAANPRKADSFKEGDRKLIFFAIERSDTTSFEHMAATIFRLYLRYYHCMGGCTPQISSLQANAVQSHVAHRSSLSFGIKLSYFTKFITDNGGRDAFIDKSTHVVCAEYLKPITVVSRLSLCEQNLQYCIDTSYINTSPSWFVSHAWDYPFLDVYDSLITFFMDKEEGDETYVYFDLFSNSQHNGSLPFEFWKDTFINAVGAIGKVVLVVLDMRPSETRQDTIPFLPYVLTRSWCIFEIYAAHTSRSELHITMNSSNRELFYNECYQSTDRFLTYLASIRLETASATNPTDKDNIDRVIQESISFIQLDHIVFSSLVDVFTKLLLLDTPEFPLLIEEQAAMRDICNRLFQSNNSSRFITL